MAHYRGQTVQLMHISCTVPTSVFTAGGRLLFSQASAGALRVFPAGPALDQLPRWANFYRATPWWKCCTGAPSVLCCMNDGDQKEGGIDPEKDCRACGSPGI